MTGAERSVPAERLGLALAIGLVLVGCVLRLVQLDADPHYYGWTGHIYDEGRWVQQARSLALRGVLIDGVPSPNLLVAPGFEAVSYASFLLAGVGRAGARLFPALCGGALLLLLFAYLRRCASPAGLVLGVGLIALQADAVVLSRVAVPEMPAMLGSLAAFVALTARPPTPRRLAFAGVLTGVTVLLKATTLPLVGIFAAVVASLRGGASARQRGRDLASFGLGLALVAIPGAALGLWLLTHVLQGLPDLADPIAFLGRFIRVREPYAIFALPLEGWMAPVVNPACLALWAGALAGLTGPLPDPGMRRRLRAATLWAVLYIGVILIQGYFPERYIIHLLIPLAVIAALATTRLEAIGAVGVARGIEVSRGVRRAVTIGTLCLPSAVLLAPVAAALAGASGAPAERLSVRLLALVAAWVALGIGVSPRADRPRVVGFLVAFPLAGAVLWFPAWALGAEAPLFWIEADFVRNAAARVGGLLLAAGLAATALRVTGRPGRSAWAPLLLACVWSLTWAVHLAPGFLAPHYTVRDASRALGEQLAGTDVVFQERAEGLFLDNTLRYRWIRTPFVPGGGPLEWKRRPAEYLVALLPFAGDERPLQRVYELVRTFDLYAPASRWIPPPASSACPDARGWCVGLFRRRVR